jgi:hypothetical protein
VCYYYLLHLLLLFIYCYSIPFHSIPFPFHSIPFRAVARRQERAADGLQGKVGGCGLFAVVRCWSGGAGQQLSDDRKVGSWCSLRESRFWVKRASRHPQQADWALTLDATFCVCARMWSSKTTCDDA